MKPVAALIMSCDKEKSLGSLLFTVYRKLNDFECTLNC